MLALVVCLVASACESPTEDRLDDLEATSCASVFGGVGPNEVRIIPLGTTIAVGNEGTRLTVCFYRDKVRPQDAQATTWETHDPSIATASPTRGPETYVKGHRFGVTRVTATVAGIEGHDTVVVCDTNWSCPPPPYE